MILILYDLTVTRYIFSCIFFIIGYVDVFPTLMYKLCRCRIFIILFKLLYFESSEFRLYAKKSMPQMIFKSVCSPAYDCSWYNNIQEFVSNTLRCRFIFFYDLVITSYDKKYCRCHHRYFILESIDLNYYATAFLFPSLVVNPIQISMYGFLHLELIHFGTSQNYFPSGAKIRFKLMLRQ